MEERFYRHMAAGAPEEGTGNFPCITETMIIEEKRKMGISYVHLREYSWLLFTFGERNYI